MKSRLLFKAILIIVLAFFVNNVFSQPQLQNTFNQPGTITVDKNQYKNNLNWYWKINVQANKPVVFVYEVDIENYWDNIDIYEEDNFGYLTHIATLTGACSGIVSTNLTTGKAQVFFKTDYIVCGFTHNYTGFKISFGYPNIDNQFIANDMYVGNNISANNNLFVNNKLTVKGRSFLKDNLTISNRSYFSQNIADVSGIYINNEDNYNQYSLYSEINKYDGDAYGMYSFTYSYNNAYGMYSYGQSYVGDAYGMYSYAKSSTGNVYGLYSSVSGPAGKKWAGYFNGGDVEIKGGNLILQNAGYKATQTLDNTGYKLNVANASRNYKVAIGGTDKFKILTKENYSLGENSLISLTSSGENNIGVGAFTLEDTQSGSFNVALGAYSQRYNQSGYHNIALGACALKHNQDGWYNIAIGNEALLNNKGNSNTALGVGALYSNTTGTQNIALGSNSLYNNNGSNNIALGANALGNNTSGSNNVGMGYQAGVYIGSSGYSVNSTGFNSIFIGNNTRALGNNQGNQIVIGYNAIGNGANTVTLGNDAIERTILKGKIGIGTPIPDALLTVNGTVHAKKMIIDIDSPLSDFVFAPEYNLISLPELKLFVKENRHLPDIPSAAEVQEKGIDIGEFQNLLLQKVEELTLYIIQQQEEINRLNAEIKSLKNQK